MAVQASYRVLPLWSRVVVASAVPGWRWTRPASVCHQYIRRYSIPTNRESRWRFEADRMVKFMVHKVETGWYALVTSTTLNTSRPLTPELFEKALVHLQRKVKSLQVCLTERNGQMWIADMETPKVNFQVLKDGQLEDIMRSMANTKYNLSEGPLWRVQLVECPPDEPCKFHQIKDAFPHQYHLVFHWHHATNDTISILAMQQTLFKILDDMLDGAPIDDKPIGELRDRDEDRKIEAKIMETLDKDPQKLKVLLDELDKLKNWIPLITEAFGEPQELSPDTFTLPPQTLDHKLVQVFTAKCKAHNVTFNSGFLGVMNAALVELVREAGVVRDSYTVSSISSVDTRRYMRDLQSMVWGYHACSMNLTMKTPWNVKKNFWKFAVDYDTMIRTHINTMGPLQDRLLKNMVPETMPNLKHKVIYDFFVINVYSPRLKSYIHGKHIQLTDFKTYCPLTQTNFAMNAIINGFQDQVMFELHISSGFITMENATKFSDKVISSFNDIAKATD